MMNRTLLTLALLSLAHSTAAAAPAPETYDVRIRYQIDAFRNQRLGQFAALTDYLKSIGLEKAEGPEDEAENPKVTLMTGTISAAQARKILAEPHVQTVLLLPTGSKLPQEAAPVRVHLELASFLNPAEQRLLSGQERPAGDDLTVAAAALEKQRQLREQTLTVLKELGFREAVGYDTHGETRLVGMLPAGKVPALLGDLRKQPAGEKLPAPFKTVSPLRLIEVMALPFPVERPLPLLPPKGEERITPELRALLADEGAAAKPVRMEVILAITPGVDEPVWRKTITNVGADLMIEGRSGPCVTVFGPAKRALALAALPAVSTVRLPRSGQPRLLTAPAEKGDGHDVLVATGLAKLHALGHRGKGFRVVLIDGDFRGWQGLVGKELPANVRYLDINSETQTALLPEDAAAAAQGLGHGAQCARAAALAAPEAELTLIRVDPYAPYQLQEVARAINGESVRSESLDQRSAELTADRNLLDRRTEDVLRQRRELLELHLPLDPDLDKKLAEYGLDAKNDKELIDKQRAYVKAKAALDKDEKDYKDRLGRYLQLREGLLALKGTHVVGCTLVWNEGHPVDGSSGLSRYFDDRPYKAAIWLQSAGNTRGQSWSGLFRDADGNGVMEFAPPGTRLADGRWTRELNFLAWQPAGKPQVAELPAGARLRVSIQWREAHDPKYLREGEDAYRAPLANLSLVVLRQLDPTGAQRPVDDLEVVAQSVSLPQRLDNQLGSATYEQTVDFTVKEAGNYALRVEGRLPESIQPQGVATLSTQRTTFEVRPRIFVQTLEGPGRAVFADYAPLLGGVGMPGDAHRVITVGAADRNQRPQPYSAEGPPHNLALLVKPEILAMDDLPREEEGGAYGTNLATSFAAGLTASALSAGYGHGRFLEAMQVLPGGVFRVPQR
jgi:hypothetical protein